jgi:hypothetical protein
MPCCVSLCPRDLKKLLETNRNKHAEYIHELIMNKDIEMSAAVEPEIEVPDLKVLQKTHFGKERERSRRGGTTSWWHTRRCTAQMNNTQRAQHRSMFHPASPQRSHDATRFNLFFDST